MPLPELWECPPCGARFVTRNMWHGCALLGRRVLRRHATTPGLYDAVVVFIGSIGPFEQVPTKSRIAFMVRVRFAGMARLRRDGLGCSFWLKREIRSPRFSKVELLGKTDMVYRIVLREGHESDDEVRGWMEAACEVGRRSHLVV